MLNPLGSMIIGLKGLSLDDQERAWLEHPMVIGVILFTRNFESKKQLHALCLSIKKIRADLLISVDHEGGRVQRFRSEFSLIPDMRSIGILYDEDKKSALIEANRIGFTLASELREVGVDFSYTPVCDLDYGNNQAIGNRAFHHDPIIVSALVCALYQGLKRAGSIGVAKHFPGHGFVEVDTHLSCAIDDRSLDQLLEADLLPFKALIKEGIEAIMPAHIIYPCIDKEHTAVSSLKWTRFLREQLGFKGLIISDDLDMEGALHLGNPIEKIQSCFDAGVDIVLYCNDFDAIEILLDYFPKHVHHHRAFPLFFKAKTHKNVNPK